VAGHLSPLQIFGRTIPPHPGSRIQRRRASSPESPQSGPDISTRHFSLESGTGRPCQAQMLWGGATANWLCHGQLAAPQPVGCANREPGQPCTANAQPCTANGFCTANGCQVGRARLWPANWLCTAVQYLCSAIGCAGWLCVAVQHSQLAMRAQPIGYAKFLHSHWLCHYGCARLCMAVLAMPRWNGRGGAGGWGEG
jgi:hypothetical protein